MTDEKQHAQRERDLETAREAVERVCNIEAPLEVVIADAIAAARKEARTQAIRDVWRDVLDLDPADPGDNVKRCEEAAQRLYASALEALAAASAPPRDAGKVDIADARARMVAGGHTPWGGGLLCRDCDTPLSKRCDRALATIAPTPTQLHEVGYDAAGALTVAVDASAPPRDAASDQARGEGERTAAQDDDDPGCPECGHAESLHRSQIDGGQCGACVGDAGRCHCRTHAADRARKPGGAT